MYLLLCYFVIFLFDIVIWFELLYYCCYTRSLVVLIYYFQIFCCIFRAQKKNLTKLKINSEFCYSYFSFLFCHFYLFVTWYMLDTMWNEYYTIVLGIVVEVRCLRELFIKNMLFIFDVFISFIFRTMTVERWLNYLKINNLFKFCNNFVFIVMIIIDFYIFKFFYLNWLYSSCKMKIKIFFL